MITKEAAKEALNELLRHVDGCSDPHCRVCERNRGYQKTLEEFIEQTPALDMSEQSR